MAEAVDWKKKHLDVLREMETEERRWRGIEQVLRRLVGRLCAIGMGDDPLLDLQLDRVAKASRRDADESELKELFDALTQAVLVHEKSAPTPTVRTQTVRALSAAAATITGAATTIVARALAPSRDAPGPTPEATTTTTTTTAAAAQLPYAATAGPAPAAAPAQRRWQSSCDAVATLLTRLAQVATTGADLRALRAALAAADSDAALAGVLGHIADLIAEHGAAIARERAEIAATLAQVTERLRDMVIVLDDSNDARARHHADASSTNDEMLAQMTRLTDEVRASDDLPALRTLVTERLEAVAASVREFRERERRRFQEDAARSKSMRERIYTLENESHQLKVNLDAERRTSRVDSLTKVPNRVAFDERFAEELARWQRLRRPVSVLVWDIDRFKSINDACGHRAGDAVLREVALCLSRGAREVDFLARFGGEEFVTLLIGTPLTDAVRAAEQMRCDVEALRFHFHGSPVRVTVSCGLTELRDGDRVDTVFDRADAALYKAKHGGRNACVTG